MNEWLAIARANDVPRKGARVVHIEQMKIALFRTGDDQYFALKDSCPHQQGPLSQGIVHGKTVTCPLHNWKVDLESGEAQAPDQGCSRGFPVKLEGDQIFIAIPISVASVEAVA